MFVTREPEDDILSHRGVLATIEAVSLNPQLRIYVHMLVVDIDVSRLCPTRDKHHFVDGFQCQQLRTQ